MKRYFLFFLCLSLAACFPAQIMTLDQAPPIPKPGKSMAMVVFVRPERVARKFESRVYDGGKLIGILAGSTHMYYEAVPGRHVFGALSQSMNIRQANYCLLDSNLLGGRTYYVHANMLYSYANAVLVLDPIVPGSENWSNLDDWLKSTRRTEMLDEALFWEAENAEKIDAIREQTTGDWLKRGGRKMIRPTDGV